MAFLLHRAFANDRNLFVINDLRIEDAAQPEYDGRPGVCQIDHLVVHRWGAFIIESKSISGCVEIRDDGSGGDQWVRVRGRQRDGMDSPLRQGDRQREFLRAFLQRDAGRLLGMMPVGLRTLSRLVHGTSMKSFRGMPMQVCVAVSGNGEIRRVRNWKEPKRSHPDYVKKADTVPDVIRREWQRHAKNAPAINASLLRGEPDPDYGEWTMTPDELCATVEHLLASHIPRSAGAGEGQTEGAQPRAIPTPQAQPFDRSRAPRPLSAAAQKEAKGGALGSPVCKICGGKELTARNGRYGHYLKCAACDANTRMVAGCPTCGAAAGSVGVSKIGDVYTATCGECRALWVAWQERIAQS